MQISGKKFFADTSDGVESKQEAAAARGGGGGGG